MWELTVLQPLYYFAAGNVGLCVVLAHTDDTNLCPHFAPLPAQVLCTERGESQTKVRSEGRGGREGAAILRGWVAAADLACGSGCGCKTLMS